MTLAAPPDPLRLTNCPGCGYALEGLAPEGACPECGGAYDQSAVVLHGFGAGYHADVATGRPRFALTLGLVTALMLWWAVRDWLRGGRRKSSALVWVAIWSAWVLWMLWKRWMSDMPGLVQVLLAPEGVRQVNNPIAGKRNTGRLTPWADIADASIRAAGDNTVRIRVVGRTTFWRCKQLVDAEVRCSPETADALKQRVAVWRGAAWNSKTAAAT